MYSYLSNGLGPYKCAMEFMAQVELSTCTYRYAKHKKNAVQKFSFHR